jgi:hypothetical protein
MFFDVMMRETKGGKLYHEVYRCHENELSKKVREIQDKGAYVLAVIPLRRRRDNGSGNSVNENKV